MSGERVLRNTSTTRAALVTAIVFVLCAAVAARYAIAHSPFSSKTLADQWVLTVILLVCSVFLILLWRTRVIVTPGSATFVVKNLLRTHRVAWSDVENITDRTARIGGGPGGRTWIIRLRLHDGHSISATALGGIGDSPLALVRELESFRAKASTQATGATLSGRPSA